MKQIIPTPITIALIVICVILYIPEATGMGINDYLAISSANAWNEPWTFITAMFAHGSLEHLACNMISLWYMGSLLERMQGSFKFSLVYFVSGIIGNLAFVQFGDGYAVGASGAIFGLIGALVILSYKLSSTPQGEAMFKGIGAMLVVNILNSFLPGIAMEAHFGGLAAGVVMEFVVITMALNNYHEPVNVALAGSEHGVDTDAAPALESVPASGLGSASAAPIDTVQPQQTSGEFMMAFDDEQPEPPRTAPATAPSAAGWQEGFAAESPAQPAFDAAHPAAAAQPASPSSPATPTPPAPNTENAPLPATSKKAKSAESERLIAALALAPESKQKSLIMAAALTAAVVAVGFLPLGVSVAMENSAPVRVIGSEAAIKTDPQESTQWAGDESMGCIQVPSDWEMLAPDTSGDRGAMVYILRAPGDGSANKDYNANVTIRWVEKSYLDAAENTGKFEKITLNGRKAAKLTYSALDGVTYFVDRDDLAAEGEHLCTEFAFAKVSESNLAWIEESMSGIICAPYDEKAQVQVAEDLQAQAALGGQASQWAGHEDCGYVQLPEGWVRFYDKSSLGPLYSLESSRDKGKGHASFWCMQDGLGWPNLKSAFSSDAVESTIERVTINGISGHRGVFRYDTDGVTGFDVVYHLETSKAGMEEDSVFLFETEEEEVAATFDDIMATYVVAKTQ